MIYFLHGNGLPGGCYKQFTSQLAKTHEIIVEPVIHTAPSCPPAKRWSSMRDFVANRIEQLAQRHGELTLVGHSMGGYLHMLATDKLIRGDKNHRKFVSDIILIDSPVPVGWRNTLLKIIQTMKVSEKLGPAPIAARRRNHWASKQEALEFFQSKKFTQDWHPDVINDYIDSALKAGENNNLELTIPRQTESDIYAHIPATEPFKALKRLRDHGINPAFIAGEESNETRLGSRKGNYAIFANRLATLPTGHLVPFELPRECAAAVTNFIAQTA
jgi:pimeloyl-ACP methyl ester carboxylesterase